MAFQRSVFWLCRVVIVSTCAVASVLFLTHGTRADELTVQTFQDAAYSGDFEGGIDNVEAIARAQPSDANPVFAKGVLQFFLAIKNLQKDLYDNSRGARTVGMGWLGGMVPSPSRNLGAVFLPPNPAAKPMTYQTLRGILARFVDDMSRAEATLALVGDRDVKLPLAPLRIAIDFDHDGSISPGERLVAPLFGNARGVQRALRNSESRKGTLAFDTADASWLRGYANVFLASANALLAFDFERSYDTAAHHLYGLSATKFGRELLAGMPPRRGDGVIQADIERVNAEIKALKMPADKRLERQALYKERSALGKLSRDEQRTPEIVEERKRLRDALSVINKEQSARYKKQNELRLEKRHLEAEKRGEPAGSGYDGILDLVAYVHTMDWKVIEPLRFKAVRSNLLQVMVQNRTTWRLVRLETDDDREWLPNPNQTSPFGGRQLTDAVIDSWLATTELAEQVLNGEKLLPHPRFKKGINLKRFFETATHLDVVLLVTGHDAVAYLEEGDTVDSKTWKTITNPMGSQFAMYAFWFN